MRFKIQIVISPQREIEMSGRRWKKNPIRLMALVCEGISRGGSERENMGLIFCLGENEKHIRIQNDFMIIKKNLHILCVVIS